MKSILLTVIMIVLLFLVTDYEDSTARSTRAAVLSRFGEFCRCLHAALCFSEKLSRAVEVPMPQDFGPVRIQTLSMFEKLCLLGVDVRHSRSPVTRISDLFGRG
jgi:hypothetical protein